MQDVALELRRNNRRLQALGEKAQLQHNPGDWDRQLMSRGVEPGGEAKSQGLACLSGQIRCAEENSGLRPSPSP